MPRLAQGTWEEILEGTLWRNTLCQGSLFEERRTSDLLLVLPIKEFYMSIQK